MAVQPVRHRFTVDDYYRMAESGVLGPDDRVELIEGEIVEMSPIGSRQAACVGRLTRVFSRGLHETRAIVWVQNPVRLDQHSEPEPDLALLRPRPDYYADSHPGPGDVLLLVEVCDTTWAFDHGVKLPLYAAAGIPEVWLVNLVEATIEVSWEPGVGGYGQTRALRPSDSIAPHAFADLSLEVVDLLP
ncbi:MAG: Uma2 family endonuclease [Acidimicrobiales bacterium]